MDDMNCLVARQLRMLAEKIERGGVTAFSLQWQESQQDAVIHGAVATTLATAITDSRGVS